MHRIAAFVAVLLLAVSSWAHAGVLEAAARESGKPLVVRFGLDRCLQCIKQGEVFERVNPRYAAQLQFRFVHIGEEEEMAAEYKILLIPTILFFDAEGTEVFRHVGYLSDTDLEAEFRRAGLVPAISGG